MKRFYLLSPDPAESGAVPPAADAVQKSKLSEEDASELARARLELQSEKEARKREQTRLSELEDENRRLKNPPTPADKTKAKAAEEKSHWLNGVL